MRFIKSAFLLVIIMIFGSLPLFAQETEAVVIDEVIAQVNDGVITLSRVNAEMNEAIASLVQVNKKTEAAAKAEVEAKKGELIANLINEELILQKGKELGVDANVDAEINQRFVKIMKDQGLKSVEALFAEMQKSGLRPDDIRSMWRAEITKDAVIGREVYQKTLWGWSDKELKTYFEANKAKFTKPETVELSEMFLSFAGRDEKAVIAKAEELMKQLNAGADFTKLALENSERQDVQKTKGKVGIYPVTELNDKIATAIKGVKAGGYAKFQIDEGIEIIRVDQRTAGSSESVFNENEVRRALTLERFPQEQKKYLAELRKDAYIKISEGYRALITPFLADEKTTAEVTKPKS